MDKAPTTLVRLSEPDWIEVKEALQYAAAMRQAVSPALLNRFVGRKFEPTPQVVGQASDLIEKFVICRMAPGPVAVSLVGPAGSGKTALGNAIEAALRVVQVPVQIVGNEPHDDQTPVYIIQDGDPPRIVGKHPALGMPFGRDPDGFVTVLPPDPPLKRLRRYLGRLVGRIREALSR